MQNLHTPPKRITVCMAFSALQPLHAPNNGCLGRIRHPDSAPMRRLALSAEQRQDNQKLNPAFPKHCSKTHFAASDWACPCSSPTPNNRRKNAVFIAILVAIVVGLWFLPFNLLGWMVPSSPGQITAYFKMADSMTLFSLVEVVQNTAVLPANLALLGYLWIPAVLIGYYLVYRNPPKSMHELAEKATVLLLIFFLTRTWLSEPNLNLIIALALFALASRDLSFRNFHFLWVLPLVFMFFNTAVPQLFFLVDPSVISGLAQLDQSIRFWRLLCKFPVVVVWQVFAWRLVIKLLSRKSNGNN